MEGLTEENISGKILDHLGLVSSTIDKLNIIDLVDERLPVSKDKGAKTTMGQRVAAMILNGLGFVDDRLYLFPKFLENKPVNKLLGEDLKAEYFNDDALGRCLDSIHDYGVTKFFTEISFDIGVNHDLLGKFAHFDTSTLSVYGEYQSDADNSKKKTESSELESTPTPSYGKSKNHRYDLKQMVINLATTGASGYPIWMEAHSGNASDRRILPQAATRMQKFTQGFNEIKPLLYVGDSAMYSNCVKCGNDLKWLSRVPENITSAKQIIQQPAENFNWHQLEHGYRICSLSSDYGDVQQSWLLVFSEQAHKREIITLKKISIRN